MTVKSLSPGAEQNVPSGYWDHVHEIEIDGSWRNHQSPAYWEYRRKFELAQRMEYLGPFPLSLEIEASYYCNLQCPFCPRVVNEGERSMGHMSQELWLKVLKECQENGLSAMQMDHEAESMMNPRFFDMVQEAKEAGIIDIWLHTNANMLSAKNSARLIDGGLTKINFSIDAVNEDTYKVLRVGGTYRQVVQNVRDFLRIKEEKETHYLRTRVSFVEQEKNYREKKSFLDLWRQEKGLNLITFQECLDFSTFEKPDEDCKLAERELADKYESEEPFHCRAPWETPIVDTQGNIIPCGQPVREHSKGFILGNVNNGDTIKSCWNSNQMNALRDLHRKGEWYKNPMCRVCVNSLRGSMKKLASVAARLPQELEF